jgi:uncharacterized protein (DUF885 family)
MSESERINLEIYRYQIGTLIDGQKFKEWEKPVNSLETFWSGVQGTGQRGFRTEQDYLNYLTWLTDIPRFFDENIANMRAGLARGFTPPKVTLAGRDQTIAPIAKATVRRPDAVLEAVHQDAVDDQHGGAGEAARRGEEDHRGAGDSGV